MNRNESKSSIRSSIFVVAALFAAALAGCASTPSWNYSNEMASLADFGGGGGDGGSGGAAAAAAQTDSPEGPRAAVSQLHADCRKLRAAD